MRPNSFAYRFLSEVVRGLSVVVFFASAVEAADVEMRSGEVRVGTVQHALVQVCGIKSAGIPLAMEGDPVRFRREYVITKLTPDATTILLGAVDTVLIRVIDGKDVETVNANGIVARPDRSRYFVLAGKLPAYPALETVLSVGMPKATWLDTDLVADEDGLMGQFIGQDEGAIVGFISGARGLDQRRCRLAGSVQRTEAGAVRVLPTISLGFQNDTASIPVDVIKSPTVDPNSTPR